MDAKSTRMRRMMDRVGQLSFKPKLYKLVPPIVERATWFCSGGNATGIGSTPAMAYLDWRWNWLISGAGKPVRFADDFKPAFPNGPQWPGDGSKFTLRGETT